MAFEIINPDSAASEFHAEWNSGSPTLTAHTSGSTGAPKEIRLPRADMLFSALATNNFFGINHLSILVSPLSASYIAGKMMIVRALLADCPIIFLPPSSRPLSLLSPSLLGGSSISLLPIVPAQLPGLLDYLATNQDVRVDNVIIGGAPLSPEAEKTLLSPDIPFRAFATYGMTETCSHVALRPLFIPDAPFEAMPGIEFEIHPTRASLIISSPHYSFRRLITNDAVQLLSPTSFRWLGRIDNVINSGGIKLHPELLERQLSPAIHAPFYLTSAPSERWGEELVMVVEGADINPQEIIDICHRTLPDSKHCPRRVIIMPEIPRTPSGKIIRQRFN